MTSSLQSRIDAMAYPPTHTYRLSEHGGEPYPTGILAERWDLLRRHFPPFAPAREHFLDVGCNKGFFSLTARALGFTVEAIDTDPVAVDLCRSLGLAATRTTFRAWAPPLHRFALVFVGNVNHYCYQEAGWSWVRKLAAVTTDGGTVIIEGPEDASECRDILTMTPRMTAQQMLDFHWPAFERQMSRWFTLASKQPTVGYTPARYITVWRRRRTEFYAATGPEKVIAENKAARSRVLLWPGDRVAKVYDNPPPTLARSLEFACMSSYATPRLANCPGGWIEELIPIAQVCEAGWRRRPYSTLERTKERSMFRAACLHNAELARMGMVDVDMSPANWFHNGDRWLTWDKNSVWPIATIDDAELGTDGRFMRTLEFSCNPVAVPVEVRLWLAKALATRDSVIVELAFAEAAREMT